MSEFKPEKGEKAKSLREPHLPRIRAFRLLQFQLQQVLQLRLPYYVITDVERKRKFVCVDPHDMPIIAVVDPEMMSSMPKGLTASTGMDALTHAIEGYTTKAAWEMTDMFHLKAIELISKSLRGAVENTKEGREGMALGQYIAGMGFSNVGLGIAHSMAHTLGAVYDTPHGVACAPGNPKDASVEDLTALFRKIM